MTNQTPSGDRPADRYAVIGHPVEHSQSPFIHAEFARETGQHLTYERLLAPLDAFAATVSAFIGHGARGANVTVPFKLEAHALADRLTERAQAAGAVNTLVFDAQGVTGDNTDGVGLVRDIEGPLGVSLKGRRVLLLGAGGASRGAMLPLIEAQPAALFVANRTAARADELVARFTSAAQRHDVALAGGGWDATPAAFDVVINATAGSLQGDVPPLPKGVYAPGSLAYDMMYGAQPTVFMTHALSAGAARAADGLGMLVEQAAEAFAVWRGVRPSTETVRAALRARLAAKG
ncbi:shikimate dehydrogenase [Pandoraea fibrosis]|uniref:Shikimate dehydrogenase (NADP(+)) n=1 Tax=Pandoraea fibrosis TaxID=1891094 RepID=A0ABX6HP87_9BURK|nr:shikimate dehydrogenase [Pandoraea fibrosis]QHE94096.1 shikimate dehydrogenase [Pandoraea fibrosis]QHF12340.1 shikimate dehydrogenase [Pandoraea fibrosis]